MTYTLNDFKYDVFIPSHKIVCLIELLLNDPKYKGIHIGYYIFCLIEHIYKFKRNTKAHSFFIFHHLLSLLCCLHPHKDKYLLYMHLHNHLVISDLLNTLNDTNWFSYKNNDLGTLMFVVLCIYNLRKLPSLYIHNKANRFDKTILVLLSLMISFTILVKVKRYKYSLNYIFI